MQTHKEKEKELHSYKRIYIVRSVPVTKKKKNNTTAAPDKPINKTKCTRSLILGETYAIIKGDLIQHFYVVIRRKDDERIFLDRQVRKLSSKPSQGNTVPVLVADLPRPLQPE